MLIRTVANPCCHPARRFPSPPPALPGAVCVESGRPLPAALRARAESFFGYDFGAVRIHVDSAQPAALGCVAFACGIDIHVAPGFYAPGTDGGADLLFHELAHVVQQSEGRVMHSPGSQRQLVQDAALEAEADELAALARCHRVPAGPLRRLAPATGRVMQPIVTLNGTEYKKSGQNNAAALWALVVADPYYTQRAYPASESRKMKTKAQHWVDAPKAAALFGKGHNKSFRTVEELARSLHGRVTDADSKAIEGRLASKIKDSRAIKTAIREFIAGPLVEVNRQLRMHDDLKDELDATDIQSKGRYAYFYSSGPGSMSKKYQRSLSEALTYMNSGRRSIVEMASFLCDYVMVARDLIDDGLDPLVIPQSDARSTHFNVNEQSDWVKRARLAQVRLGAGPSATTAQVMRLCRWKLPDGDASDRKMLCIALALFAFWNLEKGAMQMRSEIHTFHEVMLVAYGYGLPAVPSLTGGNDLAATEFEYPQVRDIPA